MIHSLEVALAGAKRHGHVFEHDPPHALSTVDRFTCKKCGKSVLGNHEIAYGSAMEGACK